MTGESAKQAVLNRISAGGRWSATGKAKVKIAQTVLHVRFCSVNASKSPRYRFNINPNTLTADYEVWICGDASHYYLLPNSLIKAWYEDPSAYPDNYHDEIRVVTVDTASHTVTYATGGKSADIAAFLTRTLNEVAHQSR
jgi:uncharacterized ferritin-like protein (DUF455 family)